MGVRHVVLQLVKIRQHFLVEQVLLSTCDVLVIVVVSHFLRSEPENSLRYFAELYHYFLGNNKHGCPGEDV